MHAIGSPTITERRQWTGEEHAVEAVSRVQNPADTLANVLLKLGASDGQIFRQHSSFADYRNKVGVTGPSGHYVKMQMIRDSRTGAVAKIHPDVEAIRLVLIL